MRSRTTAAGFLLLMLAQLPLTSGAATPDKDAGISLERARRIALDHARARPQQWGIERDDVADLTVTDAYRSDHNGVTHVYLRQKVNGLEVEGGTMSVGILRDGTVLHVGSRFIRGLAARASGSAAIDAPAALRAAAADLGLSLKQSPVVVSPPSGAARATTLRADVARSLIPARLLYQPTRSGSIRVAWNLEIEEHTSEHWWNVSVDAETGAVLAKGDYVVSEPANAIAAAVARPDGVVKRRPLVVNGPGTDGASYRVYALPLESPNDGPRDLVVNPSDPLSSPYGWHDLNGAPGADSTVTTGNNVTAHADWSGAGVAVAPLQPQGGEGLVFDYPLDLSKPAATYKDAAITNLFYWNNIVHDVFFRYGFTEAAGNFQEFNYTFRGRGGDSVIADGQDSVGVNNANFATPADGENPRMQMYQWLSTSSRSVRDGDLDAGIIAHEYGHGISNRLTGGPSNVNCLRNEEQAGEGWSDWLAIALTARPGDTGAAKRGIATYALGNSSRENTGLRPRPYSTRLGYNPARYDWIKTEAVPHGVGFVWATMLWDMYWDLVAAHGFNADVYGDWTTGGNNLAIQLVMDGMKLQPCSPGFVDSRNAILAADRGLTGGANQCIIWGSFARRGLGFSASQGSSASRADGVSAFDKPPACL